MYKYIYCGPSPPHPRTPRSLSLSLSLSLLKKAQARAKRTQPRGDAFPGFGAAAALTGPFGGSQRSAPPPPPSPATTAHTRRPPPWRLYIAISSCIRYLFAHPQISFPTLFPELSHSVQEESSEMGLAVVPECTKEEHPRNSGRVLCCSRPLPFALAAANPRPSPSPPCPAAHVTAHVR